MFDELSKEQQIMVSMRKVLTTIIREITPQKGEPYPLSEETVKDITMCLSLISAREQELAEEKGITVEEFQRNHPDEYVLPEEAYLRATLETNEANSKVWELYYGRDFDRELESLKKL